MRTVAERTGIDEIVQNNDSVIFYTENPDLQRVGECSDLLKDRVSLNMTGRVSIKVKSEPKEDVLDLMKAFLDCYGAE